MKKRARTFGTALFALLAAFLVTLTPTQLEAQDENRGREIMPEAPEIEDGELRTFALVYLDVAEIRDDMQHEMEQAATPAAQQELQQEAQTAMRAVLSESPLTIERYTQIGQILNTDPEQRAEFEAVVRDLREDRQGGLL